MAFLIPVSHHVQAYVEGNGGRKFFAVLLYSSCYIPTTETIPKIPLTKLLHKFSLYYPIISSFRALLRGIPLALFHAVTAELYKNDVLSWSGGTVTQSLVLLSRTSRSKAYGFYNSASRILNTILWRRKSACSSKKLVSAYLNIRT